MATWPLPFLSGQGKLITYAELKALDYGPCHINHFVNKLVNGEWGRVGGEGAIVHSSSCRGLFGNEQKHGLPLVLIVYIEFVYCTVRPAL